MRPVRIYHVELKIIEPLKIGGKDEVLAARVKKRGP